MKRLEERIAYLVRAITGSPLAVVLTTQIIIGLILVIGSLMLFWEIAENVFAQNLAVFDTTITQAIYLLRGSTMTNFMKLITFFGGQTWLIIGIVMTIVYLFSKNKRDAFVFLFILSFGVLLNLFLKDLFGRERPDVLPLLEEETFSFPSGHAMNSFIFYTSLSFFVFRKINHPVKKWLLISLSGLLILLIGVSRVYLGVHYPSDVVAGYIAGLWWFATVVLFKKTITFFRLLRSFKK